MKRQRNTFFIIGSIAIVAIVAFVLYKNTNNIDSSIGKGFVIEVNSLESITLVNNKVGQGKLVTKPEDIKAIYDVFETTDKVVIENWNGHFERDGGYSYTFRFNYSSGTTTEISYYDGSYLIKDGIAFSIHSQEFEKFWTLEYTVCKWDYKENRLKPMV